MTKESLEISNLKNWLRRKWYIHIGLVAIAVPIVWLTHSYVIKSRYKLQIVLNAESLEEADVAARAFSTTVFYQYLEKSLKTAYANVGSISFDPNKFEFQGVVKTRKMLAPPDHLEKVFSNKLTHIFSRIPELAEQDRKMSSRYISERIQLHSNLLKEYNRLLQPLPRSDLSANVTRLNGVELGSAHMRQVFSVSAMLIENRLMREDRVNSIVQEIYKTDLRLRTLGSPDIESPVFIDLADSMISQNRRLDPNVKIVQSSIEESARERVVFLYWLTLAIVINGLFVAAMIVFYESPKEG